MAEVLAAIDAARLTEFARAFKAAARAVVLYPDAHPAIASTLGRLAQITAPGRLPAPLRVSVTPESLLLDGRASARPDPAIGELASLLHAHLIGELTVTAGGDERAWGAFLRLLARPPDRVRTDGGIGRLWAAAAGRHLNIREIDYADVLRERDTGLSASWSNIAAKCLAGDTLDIPEELIRALLDESGYKDTLAQVIAEIERAGTAAGRSIGARAAALVRLLRGLLAAATQRLPDRVEELAMRLSASLERLTPDMMLAVIAQERQLRGDPSAGPPIVGRMSDGSVAGFVARNAIAPGAPIERLAQAFQALVPDGDRRERLVGMARDTAIIAGESGGGFEAKWQQVAERLLSEYSDEQYVSNQYAGELTDAPVQAIQVEQMNEDPPERLAAWLATVAPGEIRRLDVTLILDLLRIEDDPARRAAITKPALSLVEELFLLGDFEAAEPVLARWHDDMTQEADADRRAMAAAAVRQLAAGPSMRHMVSHLDGVDEAQFRRIKSLSSMVGDVMVRPLAETLSTEERARTRERLTAILLSFGAAGRKEVEQLKSSPNPAVRRTAIYLLREFGGTEALPDLTELLDDAEPVVQREAVRAILTLGTRESYRVLEQALVSGTHRSREVIMQAVASHREETAAPLLVYILEHVSHRGALGWVYARAIDLLGQLRDTDSIPALTAALHRGEWWAPRRTATLRRAAAAALARVGDDEAVAVLNNASKHGSLGVRAAARLALENAGGAQAGGRS